MLIVSRPEEVNEAVEEQQSGTSPTAELDKDFFEEEDFIFYNKSETYSEKINRIINSKGIIILFMQNFKKGLDNVAKNLNS